MRVAGVLALLCGVCSAVAGNRYYVDGTNGNDAWDGLCDVWDGGTCGPKATIQMALFVATDGDEVVVADGTYTGPWNKNVDPGGLEVTLRSANGPVNCTIDCEDDGRGFHFRTAEGPATIVDGFTVIRASQEPVYCYNGAGPVIRNCVITGHTDSAAIQCHDGSAATVEACTLTDNSCGVSVGESNVTLIGCTILRNVMGISASDSTLTISDCEISENGPRTYGVGLSSWSCDVTIDNCEFRGNVLLGNNDNATIRCVRGSLSLQNSSVSETVTPAGGFAVYKWMGESITVSGCSLSGNSCLAIYSNDVDSTTIRSTLIADNSQGGIHIHKCPAAVLSYCTLAGNNAEQALRLSTTTATVDSCLSWGNTGALGSEIQLAEGADASITCSNIRGGWAWIDVAIGCTLVWGDGNIVTDPGYVDPDGLDDDPNTWEDNNYHVSPDSACIDNGNPDVFGVDELDIDGEPRVMGGRVDIGADEVTARPFVHGDMNCDGVRGFADINPFVDALIYPDDYVAMFPDCDPLNGDIDGNGSIGFGDINPFVSLILLGASAFSS